MTNGATETFSPVIPTALEHRIVAILERACATERTLATAESCTGGLLASLLTDVDGASHAFTAGFITYQDEAKAKLLGIDLGLIKTEGAVSRPVAIAMAGGARDRSGATIAVGITGFAGQGAPGDEPGLVHFALADGSDRVRHREEHFGDIGRGPTRIRCVETAVAMLEDALG